MQPPTRAEELQYGKPVPVHRRRWVHRWLIGGVVAIVAGVALVSLPGVVARARVVYWQGKCLEYVLPVDRVVNGSGQPDCYTKFAGAMGARATGDMVFLHRMEGDEPLLVCVSLDPVTSAQTKQPWFTWTTFHPVSMTHGTPHWSLPQFSAYTGLPMDTRFYGGQIDPGDPKHLTIAYEVDGKKGIIDGWLLVDSLRIQMREPPPLFGNVEK